MILAAVFLLHFPEPLEGCSVPVGDIMGIVQTQTAAPQVNCEQSREE